MRKYITSIILILFCGLVKMNAQTGTYTQISTENFGISSTAANIDNFIATSGGVAALLPSGATSAYTPVYTFPGEKEFSVVKQVINASFGAWTTGGTVTNPNLYDNTSRLKIPGTSNPSPYAADAVTQKYGYFFITNAWRDSTGVIYSKEFKVCPSTQMYFRFFVANLISSTAANKYDPYLRVVIESTSGTPYSITYRTGRVVRNNTVWQEYRLPLPMPASDNTSFRVSVYDVTDKSQFTKGPADANATDGNDFAMDDFEFYSYLPTVTANGAASYCASDNLNLTTTITNYDNNTFRNNNIAAQWQYSPDNGATWYNVGGPVTAAPYAYTGTAYAGKYRVFIGPSDSFDPNCTTCKDCYIYSPAVTVTNSTPETLLWTGAAGDQQWQNVNNWMKYAGGVAPHYPTSCDDVHIPGGAANYPIMKTGDACHDIWFHFRGEIAKPHLLTYHYAYVQYNLGYYSGSTFMTNGDSYAPTAMNRDRWYALSAPLHNMASGDFSVGGYPATWQQSFKSSPNQTSGTPASDAQWYTPNNTSIWSLESQYNATAVWVSGLDNSYTGKNQTDLNALKGILEVPYFENSATLVHHRNLVQSGNISNFYLYYYNTDGLPLSSFYNSFTRDANSAYRFVFEDPGTKKISSGNVYSMSVPAGTDVMIGNPFMSNIDFDQIATDNGITSYRLYENNNFVSYNKTAGSFGSGRYIAPLQAFFITSPASGTLNFNADNVSVTNPGNTLKSTASSNAKDDVLYLKAESKEGKSWLTLSMQDTQESNLDLLLPADYPKVPQVYAAGNTGKSSIYFAHGYVKDIFLGVLAEGKDSVVLTIYNKEKLAVDGLILKDLYLHKDIDMMAQDSYTFVNVAGISDRFQLSLGNKVITSVSSVENENIRVYAVNGVVYVNNPSGEPIKSVEVYNLQGQKLASRTALNSSGVSIEMPKLKQIVIVKVKAVGATKVEKVILK